MTISKVMKTKNGQYAIFKVDQQTGEAIKLAYKKWFVTKEIAEKWNQKFIKKMLTK